MRSRGAFHAPTDAQQGRQNTSSLDGWPSTHAAANRMVFGLGEGSPCSIRSATTRSANAFTRLVASSWFSPYAITPGSSMTSAIQRPSSSRSVSIVNRIYLAGSVRRETLATPRTRCLPVQRNTLSPQRFRRFPAQPTAVERSGVGLRARPLFQRLVRHGEGSSVPGLVPLGRTRRGGSLPSKSPLREGEEEASGGPNETIRRGYPPPLAGNPPAKALTRPASMVQPEAGVEPISGACVSRFPSALSRPPAKAVDGRR